MIHPLTTGFLAACSLSLQVRDSPILGAVQKQESKVNEKGNSHSKERN